MCVAVLLQNYTVSVVEVICSYCLNVNCESPLRPLPTLILLTPTIYFILQIVDAELQERAEVPSQLEAHSQALAQFMSSGEAARIKARLTQIGRYWEELKESVQQLDGQLEERSSHKQKFKISLLEVNQLTYSNSE